MPIAFRSSTNSGNDQQVSALAAVVPAGAAIGDLVVCILSRWETFADPTLTVPTGFIQFGTEVVSGDGNGKLVFYYKRLTEADTGTYTFAWTSLMWAHVHALCFSGPSRSGDPINVNFTSQSGTWGNPIPALALTVAFAPALVWTNFATTSTNTGGPTASFIEAAESGRGATCYKVPGAPGTYNASNAGYTPASAACVAYFAIEPVPIVQWDGSLSAAADAAGDLGFAGLGRRYDGATADAASAAGDLTVSGTHVLFNGEGSTAEGVTADLSVVAGADLLLLAGAADAAESVTGALALTRWCVGSAHAATEATADLMVTGSGATTALDGTVRAYVDASAGLTLATALRGTVPLFVDASAALGLTVPLAGSANAATEATADLMVTGAGAALDLDGAVLGCGNASAELATERALAGAVWAAEDASAGLAMERALAGAVLGFVDATAELEITGLVLVDLDGAVLAFVDASAELDTTRALGATVVCASGMGADLTAMPASGGALAPITRNGPAMAGITRPTTEMASASRLPQ